MFQLKLVSHILCPFVQRAAIVLEEKGIAYTREDVDLDNPPEWFVKISPQGKVPLLQVNNADVIFESSVICEYLDEVTEGSMHNIDPLIRAKHRAWMEYGSSILMRLWDYYTAKNETEFRSQGELIKQSLKRLQIEMKNNNWSGPYFDNETFSMVDAVYAPVFRYFDVFEKFTSDNLFESLDEIKQWRQSLKKRISTQQVVSKNYEKDLINFVIEKQSFLGQLLAQ